MKKKDKRNICPRCGAERTEGMAFCTFCMESIENNGGIVELKSRYKPKVNKWFMAIVITALCILFIMFAVIILMLSGHYKEETGEQSFSESEAAEQVTTITVLNTTVTVTETASTVTTTDTISVTEEIFIDTTKPEATVTEPVTEEMPTIQVPQADFETIIRNDFDSWTGLGDAETLSFNGYSCTFSDVMMGEHINCTLTVADDFKSYVLTMSDNEYYPTGSFVYDAYGISVPIRAFAEIVLGYKSTYPDNIIGGIRDMLDNRETSCHITEENFNCDIEYDRDTQTVTVNAYMN